MIEQVFLLTPSDARLIEKVITDDNLHYLHMVLPEAKGCRSTRPTPPST